MLTRGTCMKTNKIKILTLTLTSMFLLSSCNESDTVSKKSYDTMYEHLVYCWNQSLEGIHFDNAFFGDSRVIGGDFVGEFKNKSVVNLGVGGDKVNDLINRYELIKTVTPKRVFLATGGNNALSSEYNKDKFIFEYNVLLSKFKNDGYDVIVHNVVGLTTFNSSYDDKEIKEKNSKISEINEIIKLKAEEYKFTFLDIASVMNKNNSNEMKDEYSADGVHFNDTGFKVWFDCIRELVI